jgi:ABC-2 type transport system ATP-binding protein
MTTATVSRSGGDEPVISVQDLGVLFHRNRGKRRGLRDVLLRRPVVAGSSDFWALRNISFEVGKGEAVGLIGANGCGKSTLLKMVAGVMIPDEGSVTVNGGVAPLIELTGGFVKDLTARDNIWLVGSLHGLSKKEIEERFDEIVDFAEIGDFLDTPFRHFSSGMQVRLGFAVVTQLDEPTIIVDEVLAVGDRRFKEKCYTRLEERLAQGRTLFLVSHSEKDLLRFCTRGIYLKKGNVVIDDDIATVVDTYNADADAPRLSKGRR